MTSRLNVYEFLRFLSASDKEALEVYRPLAHKHIVVTGKLDEGVLRETLVDALAKWGAVIEMHVTPSTDVLLAVDPDRMTAKRKDAARYGVSVLSRRLRGCAPTRLRHRLPSGSPGTRPSRRSSWTTSSRSRTSLPDPHG